MDYLTVATEIALYNLSINPYFDQIASLSPKEKTCLFEEVAIDLTHKDLNVTGSNHRASLVKVIFTPFFVTPVRQLSLFKKAYEIDVEFINTLCKTVDTSLYQDVYREVYSQIVIPLVIRDKIKLQPFERLAFMPGAYSEKLTRVVYELDLLNRPAQLERFLKNLAHYVSITTPKYRLPDMLKLPLLTAKIVQLDLTKGIKIKDSLFLVMAKHSFLITLYLNRYSQRLALEFASKVVSVIRKNEIARYYSYHVNSCLLDLVTALRVCGIPLQKAEKYDELIEIIGREDEKSIEKFLLCLITQHPLPNSMYYSSVDSSIIRAVSNFTVEEWKTAFEELKEKFTLYDLWFLLYNKKAQFDPSTRYDYARILEKVALSKSRELSSNSKTVKFRIPVVNVEVVKDSLPVYRSLAIKAKMFRFSPEVYDRILKKITADVLLKPELYSVFTRRGNKIHAA